MSSTALVGLTYSAAELDRGQPRRSRVVAAAASLSVHAAVIGILAAVAVAPLSTPPRIRVVFIDAQEGGGRGPSAAAPRGGPAPAPVIDAPRPPPAPQPVPERPRAALEPRPQKPRRVAAPRTRQAVANIVRVMPTPPAAAAPGGDVATGTGPGTGVGFGSGSGGGHGGGGDSGSGAGSGSGPGVESALAKYLRTVRRQLEQVKRYPLLARRRGAEGTATLAIDIGRDGRPAAVHVSASSGSELLDGEATDMVERAAPFAPLPAELDAATLRVVVPVSFDLGG